ncbi:MAG: (d)CMP kinase [Clostridia bacterium]|nr:(d)CMP kinase [Clostridia bacterium]
MTNFKQIAIDGPAGAGKSSVAKKLAEKLKYIYVDTGAMYRALTYKALKKGVSVTDTKKLIELAKTTLIDFQIDDSNVQRVICDGEDVTEAIRRPEVSDAVSVVAAIPEVRESLVIKQRALAKSNNIIMDGRDIGTIVLPDANFKFFLIASLEERAKRRLEEFKSKGYKVTLKGVIDDITKRDKLDSERETSPLRPAEDALIIDTSDLNITQVVNHILNVVNNGGS